MDSDLYCIAHGDSPADLDEAVTDLMKKGWMPCGGIAFGPAGLYQAMTRT